ncbi:HTH-type transcriptional regulator SinR [compost metagenome]
MRNDILTNFGAIVRHFRLEKGYSQEYFAELCGLHRTYIGSVERGERNITLINIVKIASALNVPIEELVKELK